jgi:hypothetical protein
MEHAPPASPDHRYVAAIGADGRPGPIEQRIGRRLIRMVDPESDEGIVLLDSGTVEWIGPDGAELGRLTPREAIDKLLGLLERRLADPSDDTETEALKVGRDRLRERWRRLGRA